MLIHKKPKDECLAGFSEITEWIPIELNPIYSIKPNIYLNALLFKNVLSDDTCDELIRIFEDLNVTENVSVNGLKDEFYGRGSVRTSGWSDHISHELSKIIIPFLPIMKCDEFTSTDWYQPTKYGVIDTWKPIAISPLLRYMRYTNESEHFTHYDAAYLYPDGIHRTLKSVVIYLTTNKIGSTRFIDDRQEKIPVWDRNHSDWNRRSNKDEILVESKPIKGNILIFNHRLAHNVEQFIESDDDKVRIIIRTDVIYEPVL